MCSAAHELWPTSCRTAVLPPGDEVERELAQAFHRAGHELYLVGGAVRDEILHRPTEDLDFATGARPDTIINVLETVPHDAIYRVGEKFGTIGAVISGLNVEVTTYRAGERYVDGSRRPDVRFGSSVEEDLTRRDFAMNAIARRLPDGPIVDPFGGIRDVHGRIVRAVGDAEARFAEDPLRLLRAVRFAAALDFTIEPETWRAVGASADRLRHISRERIADEYGRMLVGPAPARALGLARDGGLLEWSVPQLLELTRMPDHGPRHPLSLWDHTMRVVSGVPPELTVRWAALLHDIGKPSTRSFEPNGRIRFYHHEEVGARIAEDVMISLRVSKECLRAVVLLVETHMQFHSYSAEWSDGAVRRLVQRLGPQFEAALQLARADAAGHDLGGQVPVWNAPKFDELERRAEELALAPTEVTSPLDGHDLMARYGRPPGPWVGRVKDLLRDMVIDGQLAPGDREAAWSLADDIVGRLGA